MDPKVKQLVANVQSALSNLTSAMGQNTYEDGESVGNPEQDFDSNAPDSGGPDGDQWSTKKKSFMAMAKKKYGAE